MTRPTGTLTDRRYHPYGEERNAPYPENGGQKFATYQRDADTGLDYAMNRYYSPVTARFLSPDPYRASGGPGNPKSWNRYQYVEGDPVNWVDQRGLAEDEPELNCDPDPDHRDSPESCYPHPDNTGPQGPYPFPPVDRLGAAVRTTATMREALSKKLADSPEIDHSFSSETDQETPVADQRGRSEATLAP